MEMLSTQTERLLLTKTRLYVLSGGQCTPTCNSIIISNVNEFSNSEFKLYPNPSNGLINLSVNSAENLKITTLLGKVVFEKPQLEGKTIDVQHLPSGVYYCSYTSNNTLYSEKILLIK